MRIKKCEQCGQTYETDAPNSKYCSMGCREAARRSKRLAWEKRNPGYNNSYAQYRKYKQNRHAC